MKEAIVQSSVASTLTHIGSQIPGSLGNRLFVYIALDQSTVRGAATLFSSPLFVEFAFSFRRSIRRAAFFCCFSLRAHAFCRFLKVSIGPPCISVRQYSRVNFASPELVQPFRKHPRQISFHSPLVSTISMSLCGVILPPQLPQTVCFLS